MIDLNNSISDVFFPYKVLFFPEVYSKLVSGAPTNPINIEINLTNKCNHNCLWCTYGYLHHNNDELDIEVVKSLLRDSKNMGVLSVTWTGGGEPTLHPHFSQLINYAASLGFKQGLNTNGNRLTEIDIDILAKYFSYVRFSIDAGSSITHDSCHRVKKQFDTVIHNVTRLCTVRKNIKSKLIVGYSFLIDGINVDDIPKATEIALRAGVDYIQFKPVVHYTKSNEQFRQVELERKIHENLEKARAMQTENFQVLTLLHKFENIKLEESNYGRTYTQCVGCKVMASIGANGSVDICCAYKGMAKWSIGNINDIPFSLIWNSQRMQEVLNQVDVKECPPLCKSDEINRLIHFVRNYNLNREFI